MPGAGPIWVGASSSTGLDTLREGGGSEFFLGAAGKGRAMGGFEARAPGVDEREGGGRTGSSFTWKGIAIAGTV
jgi:hypothetical protein